MIKPQLVASRRRTPRRVATAFSLWMAACAAAPAFAQDAQPGPSPTPPGGEEVLTLEPTIVTATRTQEPALEAPYAVDVIEQEPFFQKGFRTPTDALSEVPGVLAQKTSAGQGSPFIRGFTGFRTLLLVDGIRLNNSTFREGPNQYFQTIDPWSVGRFEVVKGPGSVLYGSDAIGGTVNAITKNPEGFGEALEWHPALYQRYATAEHSQIIRPELGLTLNEQWGLLIGGTFKNFGEFQGGRDIGEQPNTGYDEWDADAKVEYRIDKNRKIVGAYQRVQQNNVPRTHSTRYAQSFEGSAVGSDFRRDLDQDRELTYVQYHATDLNEEYLSGLRASVSWQNQSEVENRIRSSGAESVDGFDVGTFGFWVQADSPTPVGLFTYGVEYYHDNVNSFSSNNAIQGPVGDDASYDLLGLFIQDQIPLGERFELTLGGRFTYAQAEANSVVDPDTGDAGSIDDDWSSFVGSARLACFVVPEHWTLYTGVSQGFRAPNLSDLTRLDTARSNELEIPSPGLDPEYFTSYEVGVKGAYEAFTLQAAYYYTVIDEMIVRAPTGEVIDGDFVVSKENAGDGYVQGIELGASYRFRPDWTVFGAASWQDGEVDQFPTSDPETEREPVSRLIPVNLLLGVRWEEPDRKRFFVEGVMQVVHEQTDLSTADALDTQRIPPGGTPDYELYHLRGGWRISEWATLTLAIENLTDEDYRVHGSGTNGVGRNFVFGLNTRF
jgi:hemoglobin/transferrin/lactoferrin receptor protein